MMVTDGIFVCGDTERIDKIFGPIAELHLEQGYVTILLGGDPAAGMAYGKRYKIHIEELADQVPGSGL